MHACIRPRTANEFRFHAGMDPKIRRHIWNLILRMKENRVTIMTTHSMEEADILGDNIAIMANGQLK